MKTCFICAGKEGLNWSLDTLKYILSSMFLCEKHKLGVLRLLESSLGKEASSSSLTDKLALKEPETQKEGIVSKRSNQRWHCEECEFSSDDYSDFKSHLEEHQISEQ